MRLGRGLRKLAVLRATARGAAGRATKLTVKLPKPLQAKLRKARSLPLTIEATARSQTGTATDTQRVTVRRSPRLTSSAP